MRKRGFTLIELMLLVAIIAVLFALLAPAIQRSRQDSHRVACRNNLKQFGLALHNYHDAHRTFPPGWVSKSGAAGEGPRFGWMTFVLPYMDQARLYNRMNFSEPPPDPFDEAVMQTAIANYRCPADTTPDVNPLRGDYGSANYSGNYGDQPFPRWLSLGQSDFWPGAMEAPMKSSGVFARNSSVEMRHIIDGTSNTIFVGERCWTSGSGIWPGVTDNAHENDALTDTSHGSRPNGGLTSYSSRHGNIVQVIMCDGAAREVNPKIDSQPAPKKGTWQLLGNKGDGQPIREPGF